MIVVAGDSTMVPTCSSRHLKLNQNLAWVWHFSALAKAFLGEPEAAIEQAARAMRLSPQDPETFAMQMATAWGCFFLARRGGVAIGPRRHCGTSTQLPDRGLSLRPQLPMLVGWLRQSGPWRAARLDPALRLSNLQQLSALPPPAGFRPLGGWSASGGAAGMQCGNNPPTGYAIDREETFRGGVTVQMSKWVQPAQVHRGRAGRGR